MKNYNVVIYNKNTNEKITEYTIEEENKTIARLIGIGRFRRQFSNFTQEIKAVATESKRKIIQVQEPLKWEFI